MPIKLSNLHSIIVKLSNPLYKMCDRFLLMAVAEHKHDKMLNIPKFRYTNKLAHKHKWWLCSNPPQCTNKPKQ